MYQYHCEVDKLQACCKQLLTCCRESACNEPHIEVAMLHLTCVYPRLRLLDCWGGLLQVNLNTVLA